MVLCMALPWTAPAAAPPVLTGAWVLDETAGDDPRRQLQDALESPAPGTAGRGRPGGRTAGDQAQAVPGMPRTISERLDIIHREPAIRIIAKGGREERLFTDYRGTSVSAKGASQVVTTAGWEEATLVVESHLRGGVKVLRRYRLDRQQDELDITLELAGRWWPEPVIIPLTYRRVPAAAEPYPVDR